MRTNVYILNNRCLSPLKKPHFNACCFLNTAKSSVAVRKEEQTTFRDCAEIFKSGLTTSGIYTLTFPNSTEEIKVRQDVPRQLLGLPCITAWAKGSLSIRASCSSQAHTEGSDTAWHRTRMLSRWSAALPSPTPMSY